MELLPKDYKVPTSGGAYTKLQDGENNFRILSSAIIGYEYWTNENKPVRSKERFNETPNIKVDKEGKSKVKHFWAFVVWNYELQTIQVMEITQTTIQRAINALVKNPKWGDPSKYDITITRTGDGLDTEYNVMPNPHSELDDEIREKYEAKVINLDALYEGDDPFTPQGEEIPTDL